MVLDQGRRVAGLHMAQHQNGQGQPALAQLHGLSQAAHGQPGGTLFRKNAGALHGAVAVAVGLDHCAQRQGTGTGLAPKANATRSEVAQMLMNFDQNVAK